VWGCNGYSEKPNKKMNSVSKRKSTIVNFNGILLHTGILSSVLFCLMNIFIPLLWKEYSSFSQTVSELSAIDSPTRPVWVPFGWLYVALIMTFGFVISKMSDGNRSLRMTGILLILYGFVSLVWPPMHLREVLAVGGKSITDTLHILCTIITVLIMILAMSFGAKAFGKSFRNYSVVTIFILFFFGMLTARLAPLLELNQPTPWMGVFERINITVFLIWISVLNVLILKELKIKSTNTFVR
jgi:hypothetical protein